MGGRQPEERGWSVKIRKHTADLFKGGREWKSGEVMKEALHMMNFFCQESKIKTPAKLGYYRSLNRNCTMAESVTKVKTQNKDK